MNQLGVRAHDYGRAAPGTLCAAIAGDGWRTVQLACTKALEGIGSWEDVTPARVEEARRALDENGLSVAVLGAYVDLSLADGAARAGQVRAFCSQLPAAKALGAGCVGTETTQMEKQPGVTRETALRCLETSLAEILPEAEALGVTVAIEPVYYHAMASPELTRRVLEDMRSGALRVIFDPANLFSPPDAADQRALWQRSFEAFGDRIAAVHIKGVRIVDGEPRQSGLEESDIDYPFVFNLLRAAGSEPPVLREEARPERARADQEFLLSLIR